MYSKGKNFTPDCSAEILAKKFSGFSCAKIESVLNRASLIAGQNEREIVNLDDITTAMEEQKSAK